MAENINSVKIDNKDQYYMNKQNRLRSMEKIKSNNNFVYHNETHLMKSITGFEHLEDEIEHDI